VLTPLARLIGSANERFTNSEACAAASGRWDRAKAPGAPRRV